MIRPLYIGLISGTSRDGVDTVLVAMDRDTPRLLGTRCTPYPAALREDLDRFLEQVLEAGRRPRPEESRALDRSLGEFFAHCCRTLLDETGHRCDEIRAIGSHGQTVWHEPTGPDPVSLQLGDAEVLTRETGIDVVFDFRSADLGAGGQGAPLAPLLHQALFDPLAPCAVLNLGGIANLTVLGPEGQVTGFDTGPANCLMDAWCRRHRDLPYDADGAWAASGEVLPRLLQRLAEDAFFAAPPPKSTGLEHFNLAWLDARLDGAEAPHDVQRTLLELTVRTASEALEWSLHDAVAPVLVCGGGVHNTLLMERIAERLSGRDVRSTAARGIEPDWVEAILFAWLAHQRLENRPLPTPAITGARRPVILGRLCERFTAAESA